MLRKLKREIDNMRAYNDELFSELEKERMKRFILEKRVQELESIQDKRILICNSKQ